MSEENTGFWSTVCSIFSMSKSAIKLTGVGLSAATQAINEFAEYTNQAVSEWRIERAEEWCQSQQDPVINSISGGFAIIVQDYYLSYVMYLMHKDQKYLNKILENKKMLSNDVIARVDSIIYAKNISSTRYLR